MWKLIYSAENKIYSIFDSNKNKVVSKYEERYIDKQELNELNRIDKSFNKIIKI